MSNPVVIGNAKLYLGDCREVLPTVAPGAIVCDPQYGMNYRSGYNSSRREESLQYVRTDGNFKPIHGDNEPFDPSHLLTVGVPTILWGANYYCDKVPPGRKWLIWDKLAGKTPVPSSSDVELAWTSEKGPSRSFTHLWRGIMRAGPENVANGGKLHPNQKPAALMRWAIEQLRFDGPVFDGYMGSASTGVACFELGIPYIGVEIDPEHFEVACRRLDDLHRQGRLIA